MTEETNVPTAGPEAGASVPANAVNVADGAEKTLAETDPPENAAETGADNEGDDGEPDAPRKKSGSARLRERLDREIAEKAALGERLRMLEEAQGAQKQAIEAPPREEDFNGDYFAFLKAQTIHEARQSLKPDIDAVKMQIERERLQTKDREITEGYNARLTEFRKHVADFDDVMAEAETLPVSMAMSDIIKTSERGPALAYWLAKNPTQTIKIANMPPLLAARELGRIEASISPSKPRVESRAPAPIQPVKARAQVQKSLEDMSMEEYAAHVRNRRA